MLLKICSSDLKCTASGGFAPQEYISFILVGICIPSQSCICKEQQTKAEQITGVERNNPDSLLFIIGDVKRAYPSKDLCK